jgi:hypothetical protein
MVYKNVEETLADASDMLVVLVGWMCCDNVTPNSTDGCLRRNSSETDVSCITVHSTSVNAWQKQVDGG